VFLRKVLFEGYFHVGLFYFAEATPNEQDVKFRGFQKAEISAIEIANHRMPRGFVPDHPHQCFQQLLIPAEHQYVQRLFQVYAISDEISATDFLTLGVPSLLR
jgi:hypothetical protein